MYTNSKVFRCLKMQEEMIGNGDCVGTASGSVFFSEHRWLVSGLISPAGTGLL